jgi:predicted DNA-binding transcriptional regulator AlpA
VQVNDPLLSSPETAAYVGVPLKTLYVWAVRGTGPKRIKVGRYTRYRKSEIDAWLDTNTKPAPQGSRRRAS